MIFRTDPEPERFQVYRHPARRETCCDCGRRFTADLETLARGGCLCLYCYTRRKLYQRSKREETP